MKLKLQRALASADTESALDRLLFELLVDVVERERQAALASASPTGNDRDKRQADDACDSGAGAPN